MNFTLPSAIIVLTPPGWKLLALLNGAIVVEPVLLQCDHLYWLGVTTVLNSVWVMQPCAQSRPFWLSKLLLVFQAWSHCAIAANTAGSAELTLSTRAAADIPTLFTPISRTPLPVLDWLTLPSE